MPKSYIFILLIVILSCKTKKDLILEPKPIINDPNLCRILSNTRSDGEQFQFIFKNGQIQNILGFNDFDTFVYSGLKITKAFHSKNKNVQILFDFDSQNLLKKITFEGTDSQAKPFSFPTILTHNYLNKIDKLNLLWPTFNGSVETKFEYDSNGNIKFVYAFLEGEWQILLENVEFDEKISPYKNQQLGQILSFYMVYTLLSGGSNFSYFMNANNVKSAIVKSGNSKILYKYEYLYNLNGYPLEMKGTKTIINKSTNFSEKFSYDCDK